MAVDARERLTHGAGILISRRHSWTTLWITREKTSGYDYDTLTAASRRRLRDILSAPQWEYLESGNPQRATDACPYQQIWQWEPEWEHAQIGGAE